MRKREQLREQRVPSRRIDILRHAASNGGLPYLLGFALHLYRIALKREEGDDPRSHTKQSEITRNDSLFRVRSCCFVDRYSPSFILQLGISLCPSRFCSRLYRQTGFLPRRPTSGQRACSLPSGLSEFLRHTGARCFVRSSAVGYQPRLLLEAEFPRLFNHMIGWHPHSPSCLIVAPFNAALGTHVEDHDRLFRFPQTL